MNRTIVVGDVHGCLEELRSLLGELGAGSSDRVVFLGDFMDKGPDGPGCVSLVRRSGFEAVLGNHEERHLRWRRHLARRAADSSYPIPMRVSDGFREENARLTDADVAWLRSLPAFLDLGDGLLAVHGGLQPGVALSDQRQDRMIRLRYVNADGEHVPVDYDGPGGPKAPEGSVHWTSSHDGAHSVVFGHESFSLSTPLVVRRPNGTVCYGIDTGCVHGGRLTALVRTDAGVGFTQVDALRPYSEPHAPIPA